MKNIIGKLTDTIEQYCWYHTDTLAQISKYIDIYILYTMIMSFEINNNSDNW